MLCEILAELNFFHGRGIRIKVNENTALGIALFSYDGRLDWGFNADYDLMPDLSRFVGEIEASFVELAEAARAATSEEHG